MKTDQKGRGAMHLFDIEDVIDEDTFSRGMMYIVEELVTKIQEPNRNHFVIEVEGVEDYTVDVVLDDEQNIVKTFCDCQIPGRSYCEHTAAALIALGEHKKDEDPEMEAAAHPDFETALASLSREKLAKLMRGAATKYPEVKQQVLAAFDAPADPVASARKLVKDYIESYERDGFIAFHDVSAALEGAHMVLEQVEEKAADGEAEQAMRLCLAVLAEVVDMLAYADDSGGEPGLVIHQSLVLIHQAAAVGVTKLSETRKERVFDILLAEAAEPRYDDMMEWRTSLLQACIYVSDMVERRNRLETKIKQLLESYPEDSWRAVVYEPLMKRIQLEIIETYDSEAAVNAYLSENMAYPEFREKAVDRLLDKKEYEEVLEICEKGLQTDKRPNLRRKWNEYKLHVYEQTNNVEKQKALLLELLQDGEDRHYERLKRLYAPEEWQEVMQKILDDFDQNGRPMPAYLTVLTEERLAGRILDYCRQQPRRILKLYPYVAEDYPEAVQDLFAGVIREAAEHSWDLKKYRSVCKHIQELAKACGQSAADELRDELIDVYQRRPAFVDELEKNIT
ncbi:hypothetical protein D7Z54_26930 [Salibacterium salarium]|uniref:SWIM-type domain-containing protein n=1 Tax=Salibacterium salarium TaxID=284579 RepID=A0A3R9P3G2_9BACI|nr:SWIM zinc finger family protein [Salibacterium salarium]RSL30243.1 hypothetical protein D7Z54_26930 [Salibacterium salarium]